MVHIQGNRKRFSVNRIAVLIVALLTMVTGMIYLTDGSDAAVTPGNVTSMISTGQRTHENSTAVQAVGIGATSNSGTDTITSIMVTITSRSTSFSISDIASISTNMSSSGITIYRDTGGDNDDIDPTDTPLSISSFTLTTGSNTWTYTFSISSESVPTSISGSYHWLVAVRTSTTCTISDQFDVSIPSAGITFSDTTTTPSSTVRTSPITVYLTASRYIGTTGPIVIGEQGMNVDDTVAQGISLFSGSSGTETIDSIEIKVHSISGFDPWTDLRSIDGTSTSGMGLYLDDGIGTPDIFDPTGDTRLNPDSIKMINGSGEWTVFFDLPDTGSSSYDVPTSTAGSYDLFIHLMTSSSISHGDSFYSSIPAWGLTYYGVDGISRSVLQASNRSRDIEADTVAPDISNASLRIYTNPINGYVYEHDTDLIGRDEIFYNSVQNEGLGVLIFIRISNYNEENPLRFMGEPAFNRDSWNIDNDPTEYAEISYSINLDEPNNPMTFILEDSVGHNSSFDVYFIEDNSPPTILNFSLHDPSDFIETQTEDRQVYFRPNMVSPHPFFITGEGYEPEDEAGLKTVVFSNEPSLHSSPLEDTSPAFFNGTYYISSLSTDVSSNLTIDVYDLVQNKRSIDINYSRITANPIVNVIQPSVSGLNVSGIYRIIAQVQSVPSIQKVEFGVDGEKDLQRMTLGGSSGAWEIYYIDWDTMDYTEGEHVIKVKATDMTNGVGYNNTYRVNVNNYPLWGFFQSPIYGNTLRGVQNVVLRTSTYMKQAKLYLGGSMVDTFTGYPQGGIVNMRFDTTQFQDGTHQLKAVLLGFGGRSLETYISIEIDNTAPVIERIWVDYPGSQEALKPGDRVRLMARIYDNQSGLSNPYVVANSIGGSTFQILFDNGLNDDGSPGDSVFATSEFLADGAWAFHTIRFVATDRTGNSIERKMIVAIDDKDPLIENLWVDYPGSQEGAKSGDDIQIKADLSDSTAPVYVTMVLDNSGSMWTSGSVSGLQKAARSFINQTREIDYVSIYRFYWIDEDPFPGVNPGWDKRIMNFTRMDDTGKALAISLIDNFDDGYNGGSSSTGTPIWDTIGNATRYTIDNAQSTPIVVAFTDGADNFYSEDPPRFEEGSQYYCPWHSWNSNRFVDYHWGKYPDPEKDNGTNNFWVRSYINHTRSGLLNAPIPVYTIGLGLDHHDPPNQPQRTTSPSHYEHDNTYAWWFGESGTPEFNLWRIAETSAGGEYYYAPSATFLESVYRKIANSIYSGDEPARIRQARAMLPLDLTLDVELYDDGLHNDGVFGDDIWASEIYNVPDLPTEDRAVILDVWDWANNTNTWFVDLVSDNTVPNVRGVRMVYPEGRASVGDGEGFHIEINVTDQGAGIWKIIGDGSEIGYFPPIIFNNTGKGNDINASDTLFTSINLTGQTGNAASMYKFLDMMIKDRAGNTVEARGQVLMVNDHAAPTVSMITPRDKGFLGGTDPISCIIRDDGEIQRVTYEIRDDNGTIVQDGFIKQELNELYSSSIDVRRITEGTYTLEVIAIDTAGRLGSSGALDIGIDNTIPQFTLHTPTNGSYVGGLVTFSYTFNDLFYDHVGYSIDGGPYLDAEGGMDTTLYTEGYHFVGVRGFVGSGKSQGVFMDLYFDNSIPDVDLSLPSNGIMVNGTQKVLARVMDGGGIQYVETRIYEWGNRTTPTAPDVDEVPVVSLRMDGPQLAVVIAGFYEGTLQTWGLPDGRYLLDVAAVDRSGTEGHALQYLPIDNNAPNLKVLYPVDGGAVTGNFTPEAEADDPFLSKVYFQFNGREYPLDASIDMNGIPDGKYSMKFVAIDRALRTTTVDLTVFVDKTPPGVQLLSPGNGYAAGDELLVLARVDEVAGVRYVFLNMDGDNVMLGEEIGDGGLFSFRLNMTPFDRSPHEIKVIVENNAGLITESEERVIYKGYLDTDGDGVTDPYDDDPDDPTVHGDIDGDGFGSFYDDDDDGDGILDEYEPDRESLLLSGRSKGISFKLDPTEWSDVDEDGIGDNTDPDMDGDSIINSLDAFPLDATEWLDTDRDGIGDNKDPDRDGDGVNNNKDAFPYDPTEWIDTDDDGIGNNKDDDDDGDGLPDSRDDFPTNKYRKYRYLPQFVILLVAAAAIISLFSALVFKEKIADGLGSSWKEGSLKRTRDRLNTAFHERSEKWDNEDEHKRKGRSRAPSRPVMRRK